MHSNGRYPYRALLKRTNRSVRHFGRHLSRERETGLKLIRRSVLQIARPRIGEAQWRQGEIMLGHAKIRTSDIYALFDPANLGVALTVAEGIIEEIKTLCSEGFRGAFHRRTPDATSPKMAGIAPNPLKLLVGERGFEPPAPASRRQCSTRLSYSPTRPPMPKHLRGRSGPIVGVLRGGNLQLQNVHAIVAGAAGDPRFSAWRMFPSLPKSL